MAVQFRSYGSKGNFRGNLKVSDRAAAKRDRDKEFIQELKDQNVALEDRDKTLIAALNKKYDTERSARKIVEETRRQGVEAERKQRVANAKLAADFAEQEAGVHSSNVQALTELLPQVAESINEIHEKRKAYDADQAFQALEKAGLTPDQKKEFRLSRLTAEEFATGTQAWLVALREDGGITWHQYNAMMQRTGGYGLGFERWDVRQLANSLPAFVAANGNIKNADGVSFNDALTSTNLPNNSSRQGIIEEFIAKFKRDSGLNNYSLAFREETLKGTLETQLNAFRTKANNTMLEQSINAGKEKDILATASELQAGTLFEKLTNLPADTPDAARTKNIFIRNQVDNAAEAIKMGAVTPEEARRLLDIEVTGPNNTKGTYGEIYPGAINKLDDAEHERRQADLRKKNYQIQAFNQKSSIRILKAKESILALPPSDQGAAVRAIMDDPNTPIDVKVALNSWDSKAENIANEKGLAVLEETIELGLPVTREMIDRMNLSGSAKRSAEAMLSAQENEGFTELRTAARSSIRTWIRTATGRESDEATAHDQARQVEELMLEDWFMRYNSLKGKHGPKEASRLAQAALYESFQEGVDAENPKGPYKTIRGKDLEDGLEMRFEAVPTGSHSSDYNNLKISEIYDKHGNRASQQPNILGASDEQYRTWTDPNKVPRSIISNARKLASITSEKDTYITILRDQVLLSNEPVPQWLDKIAAAHEQLAELGVSRSTLELAGDLGADRNQLTAKALSEIEVASLPTYTGDLDGYDLGTDVSLPEGTPIILPIDVTIGQSVDGFPHAYTEPEGGKSFGHSVGNLITPPDENGAQVALMFGHLQDVSPLAAYPVGTRIPAGTIIGYSGNTGSTYPGGPGRSVLTAHGTILSGAGFTPNDFMDKIIKPMYKMSIGGQQQQLPPIKHSESLIKDELDGANMELVPVNTTDKYVAPEHKPGEPLTEEAVRNPDRGADVRVTNGGIQFWFTADGKLNTMGPDGKPKRDVDIRMLEVLEADERRRGLW